MATAGTKLRRGAAEARAQKAGVEASMAVRDSAKAAAHAAAGLGRSLRDELRDGRVAERASDLAERAREETMRRREEAMLRMGEWMMQAPVAEQLGIKSRQRRVGMLAALLGVAVGLAAGMLLGRRGQADHGTFIASGWEEPESLAPPVGQGQVDIRDADGGPNADVQAPHTTVTN